MSAETVTVSHLLIIKDYSNTKGVVGVGKCFHSGSFNVGGHNWCVTYYPDGFCKNSEGHIAVFLRIDPAVNGDVKARVKFSLLDQVGEPLLPYTTKSNITTFSVEEKEKKEQRKPCFCRRDLQIVRGVEQQVGSASYWRVRSASGAATGRWWR
ncbi:hypothetical protein EJB05_23115, partial [Eragrostis curvula]